jgi:hypothetical protein
MAMAGWGAGRGRRGPGRADRGAGQGQRRAHRPLRDARQWGYQRVNAGKTVLQVDAAPPPVARHTRDGCASTLAFELSHGAERIIVNCGGAAFAGGLIPVRLAQGCAPRRRIPR